MRAIGVMIALLAGVAPARAADRDISDLFDPAVITRSICNPDDISSTPRVGQQLAAAPSQVVKKGERPPLWPGLGTITFKISTTKPLAQAYFDQGLRLTYAFNHGEAIRAFRAAQEIDNKCGICAWGEALNWGPNINGPMRPEDNKSAVEAMQRAKKLLKRETPAKERALIEAIQTRYAAQAPKKRDKLDAAYADAMAKALQAFPADADIAVNFVEAAMVASPWPWFEKRTNEPRGRIGAATAAVEKVLKADPHHAAAIHYYIHLSEIPAPEKAEPYANELASLMPGAGHMVHMPSHIFLRLGRYKDSLNTNLAAVDLDEKFLEAVPEAARAYRRGLFPHNIDMAMSSASYAGDGRNALAMQRKMLEALPPTDTKNQFSTAGTYLPVLRFADALTIPEPKKKAPFAHIVWRYARGSAYAWQKNIAAARSELDELVKERAKYMKKQGRKEGPVVGAVVELSETLLRARLAVAEGDLGAAKGHLEAAVEIQERDQLYRGDPPVWDMPAHHYLGVLLMKMNRPDDAAPMLRQALVDTPNNAWTLYALRQVSSQLGDTLAAGEYAKLFAKAWAGQGAPDLDRL